MVNKVLSIVYYIPLRFHLNQVHIFAYYIYESLKESLLKIKLCFIKERN